MRIWRFEASFRQFDYNHTLGPQQLTDYRQANCRGAELEVPTRQDHHNSKWENNSVRQFTNGMICFLLLALRQGSTSPHKHGQAAIGR